MSTHDMWSSATRLLLVLAVGALVVAAWVGGRWSAGGGGPFGMMEGRMHQGHMRGGGMMGNGQRMENGQRLSGGRMPASGDFDGEMGLRRCRAMMGTMTGMHRSMQSMMEGAGARPDSSGRQPGHGMMSGRMGHGMRGMHGAKGGMRTHRDRDELSPEQMRELCRTMHEAMRTAMHGDPGAASSTRADSALPGEDLNNETRQWLQDTRGFEQIKDRRGQDEVVVEVGAGDGLQYAPAAIRVDPGTTVRWRWTGKGGLHNVAFVNVDVATSLRGEAGAEFAYTFDDAGAYRYECTPHAGVGMRGAVIVAEES